ncbi:MAG TPA: HlyD family efflux transporter periplasmic adaptor subunit [Methylomirabilota bacterium]|jgi:biotin carboxyl carrier protein|nr:HlyD family efflux transporter periplasmic adaptor subunit [Methylomirabilota bacterium]
MEGVDLGLRSDSSRREPGDPGGSRPTPDPERALWAEFAEASTVDVYCRSWLALQCRMIAGVSGGLLLLGTPDRGPFSPAAVWPSPRRNLKYLAAAAERALVERRGLLLKREADGDAGGRERYDVAYPIEVAGRLHGVVVLDVASRPEPQLQGVLRQLQWGFAWLEILIRREEATREGATRERLQGVLDLTATALGHETFHAAATAFATALATRLDCDRVSIGCLRRGRAHVRAVSHSAQFKKQTNLIRAIGAAMDEALDQQALVVYPQPKDGPARVSRAHGELARQQGGGAACSIPLAAGGRLVGALTLERPADRPFDAPTLALCEGVAALAGPALEVRRRDDRWLVAKAAAAGRRQLGHLIGPRYVALKLAVVTLVAAAAFFATARGDYRVAAPSILEAGVLRAAVAPFNGYVAEARVRAGDLVRAGQVLCALDDREMKLERLRWLSQHEQLVKQYHEAMAKRAASQVNILAAQIDQAKAQLALLDAQLSRTRVLAPFNGVVVKGDLSQSLGAPVERGQVLFEMAPLDAYRVVLQVDEREVADVALGQPGRLVLSAFPDEPLPFTVEKLTPVSTPREGRNYFRVEARLASAPERLRPGMEGVGKIEIDRRLLIWIWTHQVIDWIRLALWRWLP